jgi:hypothetical protein
MYMLNSLPAAVPASTKQGFLLNNATRIIRRLFLLGGLTLFAVHNPGSAQGQSGGVQSVQFYAGITVTGVVGRVYALQTTTDFSDPDSWTNLVIISPLPSSPYLYFDPNNPATTSRFYRFVQQSVTTNMIYISPGTFTMGSPTDEVGRWPDETQHTVVLTCKPITWPLWAQIQAISRPLTGMTRT